MRIPTDITPLSYIAGSGSQYIETAIHLLSTDVVKSKWRFQNSAGNVYGCFTSSSDDDNFCLYAGSASTNAYIRYNGQLVRDFKATSGTVYEIEQGPDGFFVGGSKVADFDAATFTCSAPMYIFMLPNSSSAKVTARCYYLQVIRDGEVAYDFIPARNEVTGEVGMWEAVHGVWYGNSGTGDFTAGGVVARAIGSTLSPWRRRLMAACAKHYELLPGMDGKIWVYYAVTQTESASKILNNTTGIGSTMNVDGVDVPRATTYLFSEIGTHLVKYTYTGAKLKQTFLSGVIGITGIYFPANVSTNVSANGPLYNKPVSGILKTIGPIDDLPISGYSTANGVNAEIEINGLTAWTGACRPNWVKKITIKGTFSSIPNAGITGFNATNDFRYVWIESPNLTSCGKDFFRYMQGLQTFVINVPTPPTFTDSTNFLQSTNNTFKLYVPYSADHSILTAYQTTAPWSNRASQMLELNPDGTIPE